MMGTLFNFDLVENRILIKKLILDHEERYHVFSLFTVDWFNRVFDYN